MKRSTKLELAAALAIATLAASAVHAAVDRDGIVNNYADMAHAMYEDALIEARALDVRIGSLLDVPGPQALRAARSA